MSIDSDIQEEKKEIVELNISYQRIDDDMDSATSKKHQQDINSLLGVFGNLFEFGRNAKKIIDPELDYAVKFTPELLKKMQEHDVQFLRDRITGDLLPDLYDYTDKHIGGKVRLEIKGKPTEQDLTNLNNALNNLIEQQRYEALVEEIQQLSIVAKRIERGQDNDRFAKVNAGRKHLLDALNYQGSEEDRRKMMFDALALLREGRELIEKTLLDKMNELDMVPQSTFKRLWKCFSNPEYFNEHISRYEDIQEYFQYYYKSIKPMAFAYLFLKQPHLVEALIEDSKKIFEHNNIPCLASVEYLLPNDTFEGMWYKDPLEVEQRLIESYEPISIEEGIVIPIKGKDLLEVLEDGRE